MFPTRKIENNSHEVFLSNVKQFFLTYLHIVPNTYESTISYPNCRNCIECRYYCVKNIILCWLFPISMQYTVHAPSIYYVIQRSQFCEVNFKNNLSPAYQCKYNKQSLKYIIIYRQSFQFKLKIQKNKDGRSFLLRAKTV